MTLQLFVIQGVVKPIEWNNFQHGHLGKLNPEDMSVRQPTCHEGLLILFFAISSSESDSEEHSVSHNLAGLIITTAKAGHIQL